MVIRFREVGRVSRLTSRAMSLQTASMFSMPSATCLHAAVQHVGMVAFIALEAPPR